MIVKMENLKCYRVKPKRFPSGQSGFASNKLSHLVKSSPASFQTTPPTPPPPLSLKKKTSFFFLPFLRKKNLIFQSYISTSLSLKTKNLSPTSSVFFSPNLSLFPFFCSSSFSLPSLTRYHLMPSFQTSPSSPI